MTECTSTITASASAFDCKNKCAEFLALHVEARSKMNIVVDTGDILFYARLIAALSGISMSKILRGKYNFTPEELTKYEEAADSVHKYIAISYAAEAN